MGVSVDGLADAIAKELQAYGETVYQASEDGLDEAEAILIRELKENSPSGLNGYARNWKGKKKYKLRRYVGNSTMVDGASGPIPLSNILEYKDSSPYKGRIKRTFDAAAGRMASAIISKLKG